MKKKILYSILVIAFIVLSILSFCLKKSNESENKIENTTNKVETTEVIVSNDVIEESSNTIEAVENGEELETTEEIEEGVDEDELETDGTIEQENVSYDGTATGNGLSLLGAYTGETYYSQADSRWASTMYSSVNDKTQTMKSSGCGPTSAAIVVSSSKGTILPTTLATLAVDNGYRTASNGTAWSYFSFVADYFGFDEFYTTSSYDTAMNYLKQKNSDGTSKYYVVAVCRKWLIHHRGSLYCINELR